MSSQDGWAALNLEMPKRIPRTEYSADRHWSLVRAVTGHDVYHDSPPEARSRASRAFMKAWHYDFFWSTAVGNHEFGENRTNMGHAVYADGGVDYNDKIHCPYTDPEEVLRFDPWEVLGERDRGELTRRFESAYQNSVEAHDWGVNMTGIYVTCVSGLIALFGWEMLLLAAGLDPGRFGAMTNRYAAWIQQYWAALAEADVPVVMMHDDIVWTEGAIFQPEWYREYAFANYRKYLDPILASGKKVMFCSDGNYTEFVDDIAACGVHGFVFEPMTCLESIAEKYGRTHVMVGNADTRILLSGTKAEIRAEVERCMSIGRHCPGFFMAVGNHIPSNTPVENALYYNQVYEELSIR
jgi:hypothetical protein